MTNLKDACKKVSDSNKKQHKNEILRKNCGSVISAFNHTEIFHNLLLDQLGAA